MTWFRKEKNYITYNLSEVSENKIIKDILKKWEKFQKGDYKIRLVKIYENIRIFDTRKSKITP